mgnify:CR=1 FL=1
MFVVPNEQLVATSLVNVSPNKNECYRRFNATLDDYLTKYRLVIKLFPSELSHKIMSHIDPRKEVHAFGRRGKGTLRKGHRVITYNTCKRCFYRVVVP